MGSPRGTVVCPRRPKPSPASSAQPPSPPAPPDHCDVHVLNVCFCFLFGTWALSGGGSLEQGILRLHGGRLRGGAANGQHGRLCDVNGTGNTQRQLFNAKDYSATMTKSKRDLHLCFAVSPVSCVRCKTSCQHKLSTTPPRPSRASLTHTPTHPRPHFTVASYCSTLPSGRVPPCRNSSTAKVTPPPRPPPKV